MGKIKKFLKFTGKGLFKLSHLLVRVSLLSACLLLGPPAYEKLHDIYMYDIVGGNIVKLSSAYGTGTGWQVNSNGKQYVITNAHVCSKASRLMATKTDGNQQVLKVIKKFAKHDLCALTPVVGLKGIDVARKSNHHEKVWLIGHPGGRALTMQTGHKVSPASIDVATDQCTVEDFLAFADEIDLQIEYAKKVCETKSASQCMAAMQEPVYNIQLISLGYCVKNYETTHTNSISYGGNSGSPLLNSYGQAVGVLFAGSRVQNTDSYYVPIKYLKEFLNELR